MSRNKYGPQNNQWCAVCRIFIAPGVFNKQQHESGTKHQTNAALQLKQAKVSRIQQQADADSLQQQLKQINEAAKQRYTQIDNAQRPQTVHHLNDATVTNNVTTNTPLNSITQLQNQQAQLLQQKLAQYHTKSNSINVSSNSAIDNKRSNVHISVSTSYTRNVTTVSTSQSTDSATNNSVSAANQLALPPGIKLTTSHNNSNTQHVDTSTDHNNNSAPADPSVIHVEDGDNDEQILLQQLSWQQVDTPVLTKSDAENESNRKRRKYNDIFDNQAPNHHIPHQSAVHSHTMKDDTADVPLPLTTNGIIFKNKQTNLNRPLELNSVFNTT